MTWGNSQNSSSDEGQQLWSAPQPQTPMDALWNGTNGIAPMQGGHISPASTGMETIMEEPSTAPTTTAHSTTSSTGSWGSGNADPENDEADHDNDLRWEQESDDALKVPKLEPVEEDGFNFDDVKAAPPLVSPGIASESVGNPLAKPKRPRGRPRKHPINPIASGSKVTKGRSKTGCITCRKRKKKCDEAKPRCKSTCA